MSTCGYGTMTSFATTTTPMTWSTASQSSSSWATQRVTLRSGDLIACGTNHEGLGPIQEGETLVLTIDEIGSLAVRAHDPLRRKWPRGVYMGHDSTNRAVVQRLEREAPEQQSASEP